MRGAEPKGLETPVYINTHQFAQSASTSLQYLCVFCPRWKPVPRPPHDPGLLLCSEERIQDDPTWTRSTWHVWETPQHTCMAQHANNMYNKQHICLFAVCSFELMKQCWEEKPQSRPSFSSLVTSVGSLLTDDYNKVQTTLLPLIWL